MRVLHPLVTASLAVLSVGQLVIYPAHHGFGSSVRESSGKRAIQNAQKPLFNPLDSRLDPQLSSFAAGRFNLTQQNHTTCATYGESQWTGNIDVSDTRRLFFWFFESRNSAETDPVIIWLNGGPGGSSMMGLFDEVGPCILKIGENETTPNPWAWNNNASLLFIDQPAGVGFSTVAPGSQPPETDMDGAEDFQQFLNVFFNEVFPSKAHLPIHIAAESYGGHYAPIYVNHILQSRRYDSKAAFWGNITSLILIDALLDFTGPAIGTYELLCTEERGLDTINATACDSIRRKVSHCEKLGRMCDISYDGHECLAMMSCYLENIDVYYRELVEAGKRSPYNIHHDCANPPLCAEHYGNFSRYLNQEHIKAALNFPSSFVYSPINEEMNFAYVLNMDPFQPTTKEVADILEAYEVPGLGDIRILVLNGNDDYVINTPGQMWLYDNLRWSGQADFRIAKWKELPKSMAASGTWKSSKDRRLVFVALDGAGHTVPSDVREGSYRVLQEWIEKEWKV